MQWYNCACIAHDRHTHTSCQIILEHTQHIETPTVHELCIALSLDIALSLFCPLYIALSLYCPLSVLPSLYCPLYIALSLFCPLYIALSLYCPLSVLPSLYCPLYIALSLFCPLYIALSLYCPLYIALSLHTDVVQMTLGPDDEFLIIATDGLWYVGDAWCVWCYRIHT